MPAVARLADLCTGHGCWPPRPNAEGSPYVFVNLRPAHRQHDAWLPHTCPDIPETHASVQAAGSRTVCKRDPTAAFSQASWPGFCRGRQFQGSNSSTRLIG